MELLGQANNPVEFINSGVLFVNRKFRVADDVDEQNVRDLKLDLFFNFRRPFGNNLTCSNFTSEESSDDCSNLLRSDVLSSGEQLLEPGIVANRIPDGIDF